MSSYSLLKWNVQKLCCNFKKKIVCTLSECEAALFIFHVYLHRNMVFKLPESLKPESLIYTKRIDIK